MSTLAPAHSQTAPAAQSAPATVTLIIDGQKVTVEKGRTTLDACRQAGIHVPTFCWHPKLKSAGACRICYVEIEKFPKLMVSCSTEAAEGMVVHTNSEKCREGRKAVIEFILLDHPLDCPTCDKGGECELQNHTFEFGLSDDSRYGFNKARNIRDRKSTFDDFRIGPEIVRNQNRCILCYKCTGSNEQIFGEHDIGAYNRGSGVEILPPPGEQTDSLYSGNLVEICPVGALTASDWRYKIRVWNTRTTQSICPFHADGANTLLWKDARKVYRATSRANDDVDEGWLSDITRYGYQIVNSPDRLTTPLARKDGVLTAVTWDEALSLIAGRWSEVTRVKGAESMAGWVSPQMDVASAHAFNKFFRAVVGTNNIDYRSDYAQVSKSPDDLFHVMLSQPFNMRALGGADVILVVGSNFLREHPNVHLWARQAVAQKGAYLFTANPFETKSADCSLDEMIYTAGTEEVFLNGVILSVIAQGLADPAVDISRINSLLIPNSVEDCALLCGVSRERMDRLALALASAKRPSILAGEIVATSTGRENIAKSLSDLALLLGIRDGVKGQAVILPKSANSAGANRLLTRRDVTVEEKEFLRQTLGAFPDHMPGLTVDQVLDGAENGSVSGMMIFGSDPVQLAPDRERVIRALKSLDFLVVADMCLSETAKLAQVVLPLASWAEYDGEFVNLEGRRQRFERAIPAKAQARPAFEILRAISAQMGKSLCRDYAQLEAEALALLNSWKAPSRPSFLMESHYRAAVGGAANQFALFVGDALHHFGHWTQKCPSLMAFDPTAYIEISPAAGERLGLTTGDRARVSNGTVKQSIVVRVSEDIETSAVAFAPVNFADAPVNALLSRYERVTYVTIEKEAEA